MTELGRFKNKPFGWAFFLVFGLGAAAVWWGESAGLSIGQRATLLALGGLVPLIIQLTTGYGLDAGWTARFSRRDNPRQYWGSLAASIAVALVFLWGAYRMVSGVATVAT